jgi:hypothetical protein
VLITLEGQTLHTICLFGADGDPDVLGTYTLEGFRLGIDPVQRRLIPAVQYGAMRSVVRGRVRKRFDPAKHAVWQARIGRTPPVRWVDEFLARDRAER